MNPYLLNLPKNFRHATPPHGNIQPQELKDDELFDEVSWSESDYLRSLMAFGQNPDPVVQRKGLKIYAEMMEDDQVKVCIDLRKKARLSTPWSIEPGDDKDAQSRMMADFITHTLDRMAGTLEDKLEDIYSAFEFGYSITEKIYELIEDGPFKGKIGLKALKTREPYNFDFKIDHHGNLLGLIYTGISPHGGFSGYGIEESQSPGIFVPATSIVESNIRNLGTLHDPFPPEKFVIYSYSMKFNNQYGRSDLLSAFRWWLMKKHFAKFWAIWLERYASPSVVATYKKDAAVSKKNLLAVDDFLRHMSVRNGIRVSDAWDIKSLSHNSGTGSGADAYERAIEAANRFISHSILCPNLLGITGSQGSGGSGGSFALGKKQFEAFFWVLNKIGRDTEETIMDEQIIRSLIDLNFPNVDIAKYPKFKFEAVDLEESEARARIMTMLQSAGFIDPNEPWVRDFLKMPERAAPPAGEEDRVKGLDENKEDDDKEEKVGAKKRSEDKPGEEDDMVQEVRVIDQKFQEREPNEFEEKIQVKKFKKTLEEVDNAMFNDLSGILAEVRDTLIATIEKKKILQSKTPKAVESITINFKDLNRSIQKWLSKVFLDSKLKAFEELGRAGIQIEVTRKFQGLDVPMEPWEPLAPQDAVDFFNRKVLAKIVDRNGKKKLVTLASRKELKFFDERAFAVTGIIKDDILNDTKQILLNGIKRQDEVGAINALKTMFNKYLEQGVAVDDELLRPHRLQTIVRTNITEAVNEGRASMYMHPDVGSFMEFWQYSAILDARTTSYCRCMDGKIFRMKNLGVLKPPAHFNCRSISVPITMFEVRDLVKRGRGIEVSEACPDRMTAFTDLIREPIELNPAAEINKNPTAIQKPNEIKLDSPPAPIKKEDAKLTEELENELNSVITRCPYSSCASDSVKLVKKILNISEFVCDSCMLPFRVSNKGDLYLFDIGIDRWERVSEGSRPHYFKEN